MRTTTEIHTDMRLIDFKNHDAPRVKNEIADSVVSGNPEHHAQVMFNGHDGRVRSGIWESTAGVFTADYNGIVEFCHILEGSARIKTEDGKEIEVSAGDGFVLDAGLKAEWTVASFVKKHFMICTV